MVCVRKVGKQNSKEMVMSTSGSRQKIIGLFLIIGLLTSVGCGLVQVIERVDNPEPYFARAYQRIAELPRAHPVRAQKICLLVYEEDEERLVKMEAPLGLLQGGMNCLFDDEDEKAEFSGSHWAGKIGDDEWRLIFERGPGLLLEAVTEDARVLIWLE